MASGTIHCFFVPALTGKKETDAAVACLLSSGFILHHEEMTIDVRFADGANCKVVLSEDEKKTVKGLEPTLEEVDSANRRNPLLFGTDLQERVKRMRYNVETGRITLSPDEEEEDGKGGMEGVEGMEGKNAAAAAATATSTSTSTDIRMVGARYLDKQRTVRKQVYVSQCHGTFASLSTSTIYDFSHPTRRGRVRPDLTDTTLTLTREHMRSLSASELKEHARFMTSAPPGFPVYQAYHFSGGMSCDAHVWLSEIPPEVEEDGGSSSVPKPWTEEIGGTTAFKALEMSRSMCGSINNMCSKEELSKLERYMKESIKQQEGGRQQGSRQQDGRQQDGRQQDGRRQQQQQQQGVDVRRQLQPRYTGGGY